MQKRSLRPSPALVVAILALVMATGGTSFAAKLITGKDVKNSSLTGVDVKNSSLTGADVKNGSIAGADLKKDLIRPKAIARKRVVATSGADVNAARSAAPEVVLYKKGGLTVYAKCFTDITGPFTYAATYVKTSVNGAIFDSRGDSLEGGATADFLNSDSLEDVTELESTSVGFNDSSLDSEDESDFTAFAPDGTTMRGWTSAAVKNGTLAGGNGVYGAGDVCLFTGVILSN